MADHTYCSIKYQGSTDKLCEILRDKLDEVTDLKKVNKDQILISIPSACHEDLIFLKSFMESEGIKISDVK